MLERSAPSRVVHVGCPAAAAYKKGLPAGEDAAVAELDYPQKCSSADQYAKAKLAVVAYSSELQRRLHRKDVYDVTSVVVDPGETDTLLVEKGPPPRKRRMFLPQQMMQWVVGKVFGPVLRPVGRLLSTGLVRSRETAAAALIHAALSPALETRGGVVLSDRAGPFDSCGQAPDECGVAAAPDRPSASKALRVAMGAGVGAAVDAASLRLTAAGGTGSRTSTKPAPEPAAPSAAAADFPAAAATAGAGTKEVPPSSRQRASQQQQKQAPNEWRSAIPEL